MTLMGGVLFAIFGGGYYPNGVEGGDGRSEPPVQRSSGALHLASKNFSGFEKRPKNHVVAWKKIGKNTHKTYLPQSKAPENSFGGSKGGGERSDAHLILPIAPRRGPGQRFT